MIFPLPPTRNQRPRALSQQLIAYRFVDLYPIYILRYRWCGQIESDHSHHQLHFRWDAPHLADFRTAVDQAIAELESTSQVCFLPKPKEALRLALMDFYAQDWEILTVDRHNVAQSKRELQPA